MRHNIIPNLFYTFDILNKIIGAYIKHCFYENGRKYSGKQDYRINYLCTKSTLPYVVLLNLVLAKCTVLSISSTADCSHERRD